MVGVRTSFEHESVNQPAVEPHPGPHPRLRVVGLLGRDEVVELPVEMRHRKHWQHTSDRLELSGLPGRVGYYSPFDRFRSDSVKPIREPLGLERFRPIQSVIELKVPDTPAEDGAYVIALSGAKPIC